MHAILASFGTDGDVFPYVGLGMKLRARGHQVTLVAAEEYHLLASDYGFAFHPWVSTAEADELLANPDFWHPIKTAPLSAKWGVRFLRRQYSLLVELAKPNNSVLVASPGMLAARLLQEKEAKPLANLLLQPGLIPSVLAPPVMPGLPSLDRLPRPVLKLFWRGLDGVGAFLFGREFRAIRRTLGLPPVWRVFQWWLSPELVIGLFPQWYGPPQSDWPPQVRLAGFPRFDGRPADDSLSKLLEFCHAGTPPVVFTFGTGMRHAANLFRASVEACRQLGRRGILLTKYVSQLPPSLPPFVRHEPFAPFQQLFPCCAAVVHHGGVGTTARALAAATPQLVLPLAFDQMDNASRVKRLGVGGWLKSKPCNGAAIAGGLVKILTPQVQARCRAIAGQDQNIDALEIAAQWVEELARDATKR
jgi:UDP:flavonoid glycosyltransferase YjiC (YdhE family)